MNEDDWRQMLKSALAKRDKAIAVLFAALVACFAL